MVGEVTSPSSRDYDRGDKLGYYQSIESLQVYLVIDQHRIFVELYERQNDGWRRREYSDLEAIVPLRILDCDLPLAEIYAGIEI